ncbi:MAG: type II CAAX endopeptidase family protein [Terriglobales bacterium]|jgi:membrane protease YdiL (CAAX protease family)
MSDAVIVETPVRKNTAESRAGKTATWIGLAVSLFSMLIIRQAFLAITPEPGATLVLAREACMFASAGVLVWLVRKREGLPLTSIGLGTSPLWKSLAWGVVIAIACIVPAAVLVKLTGYGHGAASQAFAKLPVWVLFIVVLRAGVVEELFYRGYAIERLRAVGSGRVASWGIPLVVFSLAHWTGGAANILIALVLGGILTVFYLWRRDLVSNMCGHFLVDFVSNVLPALFS